MEHSMEPVALSGVELGVKVDHHLAASTAAAEAAAAAVEATAMIGVKHEDHILYLQFF